jgi:hypothetical protein
MMFHIPLMFHQYSIDAPFYIYIYSCPHDITNPVGSWQIFPLVFQEYDDEEPPQIDEVHEALRGGHAFKKMPVEPGRRPVVPSSKS